MKNLSKIIAISIILLIFSACSTINITKKDNQDKSETASIFTPQNQIYYFDRDSDTISRAAMTSIRAQAKYLAKHPKARILIAGNTDERGSREYNVVLGWYRAKIIANTLEQESVSPNQIDLVSYGEEKPIAFGHDESSWAKNRRVELIYEDK